MSSNLTKAQKRNKRRALKRKRKREERVEIRKMDELAQIALIEDDTWDAMCYKDTCLRERSVSEQSDSDSSTNSGIMSWFPWW